MNGPVTLVYVEQVADHSAALKREVQIKKYQTCTQSCYG
jgi:predicted GIY-YIG superfamily endonuclease